MKNNIKYIILHTSDVLESVLYNQFNSINKYHKDDRKFPISSLGYYVGYHWLITGGKKYQCRLDTDEGAHCNQKESGTSLNFQSIGICWGGDGDLELPSSENRRLLAELIKEKMKEYNIPRNKVKFHRDFILWKTCPGTLFDSKYLDSLLYEKPPEIYKEAKKEAILKNAWISWDILIRLIAIMKSLR